MTFVTTSRGPRFAQISTAIVANEILPLKEKSRYSCTRALDAKRRLSQIIVRRENITVGRLKGPGAVSERIRGVDSDQDVVIVEVAERSKGNSGRLFSRIGILSAL